MAIIVRSDGVGALNGVLNADGADLLAAAGTRRMPPGARSLGGCRAIATDSFELFGPDRRPAHSRSFARAGGRQHAASSQF